MDHAKTAGLAGVLIAAVAAIGTLTHCSKSEIHDAQAVIEAAEPLVEDAIKRHIQEAH